MSFWDSFHSVLAQDTLTIVEAIRDEIQFQDWEKESKKIFSIALYPQTFANEDGVWTEDGSNAFKLVSHLSIRKSYLGLPSQILQERAKITDKEFNRLEKRASVVRLELTHTSPVGVMDLLFR